MSRSGSGDPSGASPIHDPRLHNPPEILQADNSLDLSVRNPHAVHHQVLARSRIEVNVFAIRRPLRKADVLTGEVRPLFRCKFEEPHFLPFKTELARYLASAEHEGMYSPADSATTIDSFVVTSTM